MKAIEVRFKKIRDNAIVPTRGSAFAAGYDLCATADCTIEGGETVKVGTGICMEIPDGFFGGIFARSGLATKQGLRPANCVGVVDSDYRGELIVALHNDDELSRSIHAGDRIAQLVLIPYLAADFVEVDELEETVRGAGGFGSTGSSALESDVNQLSLFDMMQPA